MIINVPKITITITLQKIITWRDLFFLLLIRQMLKLSNHQIRGYLSHFHN